jgi:hypothetical protein
MFRSILMFLFMFMFIFMFGLFIQHEQMNMTGTQKSRNKTGMEMKKDSRYWISGKGLFRYLTFSYPISVSAVRYRGF